VHRFEDGRFWRRLFLALKRLAAVVEVDLPLFLDQIAVAEYAPARRARFWAATLHDMKLYFAFSPKAPANCIHLITIHISDVLGFVPPPSSSTP
jgi:hypothetical protein